MQAEANMIERVKQAYVTYRSVRLLCILAVLVSAPALFVLAGGFPPYAWRLLTQGLAQFPALLAARGPGVLLALAGTLLLALTQFIAWCTLFWLSWKMFAYWRYERRELRAFAAELQEAQFQSGELDEPYEQEEEFATALPASSQRTVYAAAPVTRRRVIYPLAPLPPETYDEEDEELDEGEPAGGNNQFFVEEDEDDVMGVYRDEEDQEDEMDWRNQQVPGAAHACAPTQAERLAYMAGEMLYDPPIIEHPSQPPAAYQLPVVEHSPEPVYDPPLVEHSSRPPAATEESATNVHYSSYGRVLPFSAAPSAGALPHLTTALYQHVSMPLSVSAPEAGAQNAAPQAPAVPAPQKPTVAPTRPALPAQSPPRIEPTQPAKSAQRPAEQAQPRPRTVVPHAGAGTQNVPPRVIAPRPTTKLPAQPAAPAQRPPAPRPAQLIAPAPARMPAGEQAPQSAPRVQPGMGSANQPSAMQSLVELITTVPMTPPDGRAQLPVVQPQPKAQPQPLPQPHVQPLPLPLIRPDASARQATTQLVVSTGLDVGLKRRGKPNEDSLLALQNTRILRGNSCPVGLFVVADGMGGHENGQEASNLVIQSLSKTVVPAILYGPTDDNYSELLAESVHHANLEVYQRNRQGKVDMGTTIVAALIINTTAYIVSAGDSRVYLYRPTSGLTQVTRDHSTVARLVENGLIKPEEVYTHPRRNEIYRSLGHHPSEDLDKFILALQPDDVLMLCSDGLWEMVRDNHIREIIASTAHQPTQTSAALVQAALDGGGKDNISVIVVYVKAATGAPAAWAG